MNYLAIVVAGLVFVVACAGLYMLHPPALLEIIHRGLAMAVAR